jgi:hypothetical protein
MKRQRLFLPLGLVLGALLGGACSRRADLLDDPTGGLELGPTAQYDESELVDLMVPFGEPPFVACSERPTGACVGVNDFPCDFAGWFNAAADTCQIQTGCRTNGWVVADMSAEGCVERLQMTEPNSEYAECLVEVLGASRCPCGVERRQRFLGIENQPCFPGERSCSSSEFPCPAGQVCMAGRCELAGEGGSSG